ncbi:MAG: hypothetical protein M3072_13095 [Candidatus Dormibacteraeota bacterium]|nr:hypothetical protein [Candidatus Dormibacteraeota bacterium]
MKLLSSLFNGRQSPGGGQTRDACRTEPVAAGLCYCLLYDLCAWLAGSHAPVPVEVREYRQEDLQFLPDPLDRLRRYLAPQLLQAWERALAPFFAAGGSLVPRLQDTASLDLISPTRDGQVQVRLKFSESGWLLGRGAGRVERPARQWLLNVTALPDQLQIQAARLEQVGT